MSDHAIERLLRGLQGNPPDHGHYDPHGEVPHGTDCPDTEALAALADDTLAPAIRRELETHVADCDRCQMLTAAMARAERVTGARAGEAASEVRPWRRRAFNWLVPAAAAATAVALWVIVPGQRTPIPEEPELDRQAAAAQTAPGAPSRAPANGALRDEREARQREFAPESIDARADSAQRVPATRGELARTRPAAPPPAISEPALKAEESLPIEVERGSPPAAASINESVTIGLPPSREGSADRGQASGSTAEPAARDEVSGRRSAEQQERVAPVASAAARVAQLRGVPALEVPSPNPQVRWRVVTGSVVQRSLDGGATWTNQQTVAGTELSGGSAPSPDVCWLVGRGGIVLRTADGGRQWQRTTIPAAPDLTTVTAPTALNAIVTAADGRRFETTDGGRTWTPVR